MTLERCIWALKNLYGRKGIKNPMHIRVFSGMCEHCNKVFYTLTLGQRRGAKHTNGQVHCSVRCHRLCRCNAKNNIRRKGITKRCRWCKKKMYVSAKRDFGRLCCTKKCSTKWYRGSRHHSWKWTKTDKQRRSEYTGEHRKVMEKIVGRPLLRRETVHHKNGLKWDCTPSNLELWTHRQPSGQRVQDVVNFVVKYYWKEAVMRYREIIR